MTINYIQELQKEIKAEFTLLSSVALARINRHFESANIDINKRVKFSSEPTQNSNSCVHFYDVESDNEVASVILLEHEVVRELKNNGLSIYGDMVAYIDKLHEKLIEIGGVHPVKYDLGYGKDYNSNVGIGINLPIKPNMPMKLRNLSAILLSGYRLEAIEMQIDGNVSLQLPTELIITALTIRKSKAECQKDSTIRDESPEQFDIDKINNLLSKARQKLRAEEKDTTSRDISR